MTTAPTTLIGFQARCVKNLGTKNLGIVGDAQHVRDGGYHIGARSLRNAGMGGDYSLQYEADRKVNHDYACAVDIGGRPALLMLLGNRIVRAMKKKDPRVYGKVRAVNAPFDGVSIDRRLDDEDPRTSADDNVQSSGDRNHIHIEIYRSLVTNQSVINGIYDVLAGVPLVKPKPRPATRSVKVKPGDTLGEIARRNHTTWRKLQRLNNIKDPNVIFVGQKIRIP
jgi:LysM repeat protein